MAIPTGRSHEGERWRVLSAIKQGGFSTWRCERDPKFAAMVQHLVGTGEIVRDPVQQYPWVGVSIAAIQRPAACLCGRDNQTTEGKVS